MYDIHGIQLNFFFFLLQVLVQDEPVVKTEVLEEPKAEEENEEDVMNSDNSMAYDQLTSGMQGRK